MNTPKCKRCLYTARHPFGLCLDHDGVCMGCRTHEEKTKLDWAGRLLRLPRKVSAILGKQRERDYDCVVPIRGTPEYFYVLDVVKNRLGLNPLVVSYNSHFNSHAGIENLDLMRDTFDVDLLHYTSNPSVYKKLIRESLARMSSMRWPFLAGETQFPVQVAIEKRIPLVIWPLHQPTEQVGMHSYLEEPEMSRRGRHEFDLMGCEPHELVTVESLVRPSEIEDLEYPEDRMLSQSGVRGIYLSNFIPWDSRRYSEEMVERYGARCAPNRRTFDTYDRIDDCTYMTVHDMLKQTKVGYSRVTDSLCREIRFGRITRENALAIESHYQAEEPWEEIEQFCSWLGISTVGFKWLSKQTEASAMERPKVKTLTEEQQLFVDSFKRNAAPVWETKKYIVYGKGLEV